MNKNCFKIKQQLLPALANIFPDNWWDHFAPHDWWVFLFDHSSSVDWFTTIWWFLFLDVYFPQEFDFLLKNKAKSFNPKAIQQGLWDKILHKPLACTKQDQPTWTTSSFNFDKFLSSNFWMEWSLFPLIASISDFETIVYKDNNKIHGSPVSFCDCSAA